LSLGDSEVHRDIDVNPETPQTRAPKRTRAGPSETELSTQQYVEQLKRITVRMERAEDRIGEMEEIASTLDRTVKSVTRLLEARTKTLDEVKADMARIRQDIQLQQLEGLHKRRR